MIKNDQLASLREQDAMLVQIRRELHLNPGAYVDVIFVHQEDGLTAEVRCLGCEGPLELNREDWWVCRECGYEFSKDEMGDLFASYHEALQKLAGVNPERKKTRWAWVHWLLRFLRITH